MNYSEIDSYNLPLFSFSLLPVFVLIARLSDASAGTPH